MKVLITSLLPRWAALIVVAFLLGNRAFPQAYLLVEPDQYLAERTADPNKPIGEAVGEFVDIYPSLGKWTLVFAKDGVERKVRCKDIWGFTYKGVLFRISDEGPIPVRLMTEGRVCYYENGFAHLRMQRDNTEWAGFEIGHGSYLSKDIKGAIVPAVFKSSDEKSISAEFRTEHPELESLFSCIGDGDGMDVTRQCVVDFEAGLLVDQAKE